MRLSVALGCLLLAGCSGPHSTGGLWAQRLVEQETVLFQLSDVQRAERLRAFELGLVDETLSVERARIEAGLTDCPGPGGDRQPLAVSVGDRPRDTVRIGAHDDPARMTSLGQIALADWYARRARATGDAQFCAAAHRALAGELPALGGQSPVGTGQPTVGRGQSPVGSGQPSAVDSASGGPLADLLSASGTAVVSRDPGHAVAHAGMLSAEALSARSVSLALSNYALGYVDTLRARAPLPQYLAAVYGGVLLGPQTGGPPAPGGATPESLVDQFAPAYPDWEPDALYAVLAPK